MAPSTITGRDSGSHMAMIITYTPVSSISFLVRPLYEMKNMDREGG